MILLFDVMDTLVHDPFRDALPRFFGLTFEQLLALKHPTAWIEFEVGAIDEETFARKLFRDGRKFDVGGLRRAMAEAYALIPGVATLLGELTVAGAPMHAFSNYPAWWRLVEERTALSRWLQWSFVSAETGLRKPDPAAYLAPATRLGVAPRDCLLIDDREKNVAAARALGMDGERFVSVADLRPAPARRGIL